MLSQGGVDTEAESCWGSSVTAHADCTALGWLSKAVAQMQCLPSLHSMAWRNAQGAQGLPHTSGSIDRLVGMITLWESH